MADEREDTTGKYIDKGAARVLDDGGIGREYATGEAALSKLKALPPSQTVFESLERKSSLDKKEEL